MKITKRQLRRIIREENILNPVRLDDDEELLLQIAMKIKDMMSPDEALDLTRNQFKDLAIYVYGTHFDPTGEGWEPYNEDLTTIEDHLTIVPIPGDDGYEQPEVYESKEMKITKRQLRRIIREERNRLLREVETVSSTDISIADIKAKQASGDANGEHHWPRVDWNNIGELTDKWIKMEEDAWDKGDTSMNPDDQTDTDAKRYWKDQVEGAAMDMEAELTLRIRRVALQTMKEFTDQLINGEFS